MRIFRTIPSFSLGIFLNSFLFNYHSVNTQKHVLYGSSLTYGWPYKDWMFSLCVFIIHRNGNLYFLNYPPKISEILVPSSVKRSAGLLEKAERSSGLMLKGSELFHSWGCSRIIPITSNLTNLQQSQHRKLTSTVGERLETHTLFEVSVWDIRLWH